MGKLCQLRESSYKRLESSSAQRGVLLRDGGREKLSLPTAGRERTLKEDAGWRRVKGSSEEEDRTEEQVASGSELQCSRIPNQTETRPAPGALGAPVVVLQMIWTLYFFLGLK